MPDLIALIDGDTPVFAAAISCEGLEEWMALSRLDKTLENIIRDSGCSSYQIYVSGGVNFRYAVDPSYKANRKGADPEFRETCKQWLINEWGAIETDGYEADDAVGCEQTKDTIICGIDKDLLMIPGKHYTWPITHHGKVVKEGKFYDISYEEGMKRFFLQMLTGDTSDNIKGIHKIGPKRAAVLLEDCVDEECMYNLVEGLYIDKGVYDRFHSNLDLLWIWRNYGETYNIRREIND